MINQALKKWNQRNGLFTSDETVVLNLNLFINVIINYTQLNDFKSFDENVQHGYFDVIKFEFLLNILYTIQLILVSLYLLREENKKIKNSPKTYQIE